MSEGLLDKLDSSKLRPKFVGWGIIAAMGEYLDAYAIVAWSVSLVYMDYYYRIPVILAGFVPALFGYAWATTALGGGHISDLIGRKRLYAWDLIIFIIGMFLMILSSYINYNLPLLITGYMLVGVGVGLDVPTSEALLAEISPRGHRGKMMTLANILWYLGPITSLIIALVTPAKPIGFRILFTYGIAWAILTLLLRRLLIESPRFLMLKGEVQRLNNELKKAVGGSIPAKEETFQPKYVERKYKWKDLFMRGLAGFTIFIMIENILWAIPASTFGVYLPYIGADIGKTGFVGGVIMDMIWFGTSLIGLFAAWLYIDKPGRFNRKTVFIFSSIMVGVGFILFGTLPLTIGIVGLLGIGIIGFFQGLGVWPVIWVWGTERFPTAIRSAGRGFLSGTDRYANYTWTLFLPAILTLIGLKFTALTLAIMSIIMAILAIFFAPRTGESMSLEEIESEIASKNMNK